MMRVGIAGGGITGLACAHYLRRLGGDDCEAVVFDPSPGGLMGSVTVEGCILETGPESWLASKPWAEQLLREIGLGDQIVGSNDAKRRTFILRDSLFEVLPEGLQLVVPTRAWPVIQSRLLGWETKIRMGAEIFRNPKTLPDRSVSEFVADHFGQEAVDYLAEPLLAGVYGGSPDLLSAPSVLPKFVEHEQRFGSVLVGALRDKKPASRNGHTEPVFRSLRHGMGSFVRALAEAATLVPARVESLRPGFGGRSALASLRGRLLARIRSRCHVLRGQWRSAAGRPGRSRHRRPVGFDCSFQQRHLDTWVPAGRRSASARRFRLPDSPAREKCDYGLHLGSDEMARACAG